MGFSDWLRRCTSGGKRRGVKRVLTTSMQPERLDPRLLLAVSAEEQLFVYELNIARHDPVAYQRAQSLPVDLAYVTPRQPLAVNDSLFNSAGFKAEEMAQYNYFDHQSRVTGKWPNQLARENGYNLPRTIPIPGSSSWWTLDDASNQIESLAYGYGSPEMRRPIWALNGLVVDSGHDPPGHRIHLLGIDNFNAPNTEIGVGYAYNPSNDSNYWAVHSTRDGTGRTFVTGVVFNDANGNSRYDLNEGLSGVTVRVGSSIVVTTNAAGGWSAPVTNGDFVITVSGGGFVGTSTTPVRMNGQNVEVDFISGRAAGSVNFAPYQNTAPTLDTAPSPTLPPVVAGNSNPAGTTVAGLLGTAVTDPDPSSLFGIAVTGSTGGGIGSWQYSIDGGSSWASLSAASSVAARLLRQGDLVRFVPLGGSTGTAGLLYRAWDQTAGTAGATLDTSTSGGTSSVSSAVETATVSVMLSNTAPTLTASGTAKLVDIREDALAPAGTRIATILAASFSDPDPGTPPGIAVTGLTGASNGRWEYSSTGATWTALTDISPAAAVLLRGGDLLRFVPAQDFNGSATVSYLAWDQSAGVAGARVDVSGQSSRGGTTAYSVATGSASVTVTPVNDAPRFVPGASALMLKPVAANSSLSASGTSVASILGNAFFDVDGTTSKGIAVVGKDESSGTFYFNIAALGGWMYGDASSQYSLLLDANDQVAFVPYSGFTGTATIQFRLWDKTTGSPGFGKANLSTASSYGGETAFGGDLVTATAFVGLAGATPSAAFVAPSSPNAGVTSIALTFSQPVTGLDPGDFSLTRGGVAVPLGAASLSGSGSSYVLNGLTGLNDTDGAYVLTLNAANSGIASATGSPLTAPASVSWTRQTSPSGLVGTGGDGQVSLSWTAPPANAAAAVSDYVVQLSADGGINWTTFPDGGSTATTATVTGLVNGTAYLFRVAAIAGGIQSAFAQSQAVTPRAIPAAPTSLIVTPGNARVQLAWAAPSSNGGSAITDYIVQFSSNSGSSWTTFNDGTSTTPAATVTGLVNGTPYLFRVAAVSGGGQGAYVISGATTPFTVPGTPSGVLGTPGDAQVTLSWSAPSSNGGSAVTDYVVRYSSNNGSTWTTFNDGVSSSTGAVVTGLVNGLAYRFQVAAVNAAGQGAFALAAAVTPRAMPGPPSGLVATPRSGSATLTWIAPSSSGGSAITDYIIQFSSDGGGSWSTFSDGVSVATSATVTGLVNGTAYLFQVAAVSAAGQGAFVTSAAVTPFTIPEAPGKIATKAGNARIAVAWTAPAGDGGSPITDYVVQFSSNGGTSWTTFVDDVSAKTSAIVLRLTNGTPYLIRVAAINAAGQGAFVQSDPVAPFGPPTAPTGVTVLAGIGRVRVTWTPPTSDSGSAITDYIVQYSSDTGGSWTTFADGVSTATVATVTRLVNGTSYLFRVAAVNAAGESRFAQSVPIRPRTIPGSPTNLTAAVALDGSVALSWSPPSFDGGSAITDYLVEYSGDAGGSWTTFTDGVSAATTASVGGLARGRSYLFRITAVNVAGKGGSATSASVTL